MNLLGEAVKHKRFGKGVITGLSDNKITICFAKSQKLFLFPDAFTQHLTLKNNSIQKKVEKLNDERLQVIKAKKQKFEKEKEYKNRLYTMKIPLKSQVAYDILEKEIRDFEYIDAGCILSGDMKGRSRTPSNVQPNSAIILTDCGNGGEDERCIIGLAMVDECFWGKESKDGQIKLHKKHKIILPDENRISFWKYFERGAFPRKWGKVPFKYFQNQTMHKIIFDICCMGIGTNQEKEIMDLYSYFCSVNRIPEKKIAEIESRLE